MTIRKFLHSCILLEEKNKRLLIDPGEYSFAEKRITPEDIGGVDVICLTHEHSDHFSVDAIKRILKIKHSNIFSHERIVTLLGQQKIESTVINVGTPVNDDPFTISAIRAPHGGPLVQGPVENIGFLINHKVLHPGDSIEISSLPSLEVFFLPVVAPWLVQMHALEIALKIKPKIVVPIHDGNIKEFALTGIYKRISERLADANISFRSLALHETLEV